MEIIDVMQRLNEISQREITEKHGGEHSTTGRSMTKGEMNKREKIVKGMKKDKAGFKKRYGADADAVMYATATKQAMKDDEVQEDGHVDVPSAVRQCKVITEDAMQILQKLETMSPEDSLPTWWTNKLAIASNSMNKLRDYFLVPSMSDDVHEAPDTQVGAEEIVSSYVTDGGDLKMPKRLVIQDIMDKAKKASMPKSYELETAAKIIDDKFDDDGDEKFTGEDINTNTMETKDKKDIKEDMHISTDSPEEASMLMQILKMAGVKPVDASMMGMDKEMGHGDMDKQMDPGAMNTKMDVPGDDAMGSMQMAKMRNMMIQPDMEKQEENFANSEKQAERDMPTQLDVDNLVNVQSGGLNRQKQQFRKEHPGDNPMAVEDKVTEEDLANSLRTQYESFKQSYQDAAKVAEKQGTDHDKDGDIDSKDYLKSRDIAIKKAMAKKD